MNFETAFNFVIGAEGAYSNSSKDPGGETKFGISKRAYPSLDIANLTLDDAHRIYKTDFWDHCKCDLLPENLRLSIFDMAVNQGQSTAIKCLQSALKITEDGVIGNKTLTLVNSMHTSEAVIAFATQRILMYVSSNPQNFSLYGKGWVSRAIRVILASN